MSPKPASGHIEAALALLKNHEIPFTYANGIARIQIAGKPKINFWPSTGRWCAYFTGPGAPRCRQIGSGIATLVRWFQAHRLSQPSWAERQALQRERKKQLFDNARRILAATSYSFSFLESVYYVKARESDKPAVDYWPTTGLWLDRLHNRKYRGTPEKFLSWYQRANSL